MPVLVFDAVMIYALWWGPPSGFLKGRMYGNVSKITPISANVKK
jgi:hypothetical protein